MALFKLPRNKKTLFFLIAAILLFFLFKYSRFNFPRLSFANLTKLPALTLDFVSREVKALVFFHVNSVENYLLRQENDFLKQKVIGLEETINENKRLTGLLSFKNNSELYLITARVIGRDSTNWANSILIDKGSNNGAALGKLVLTNLGLVGRISEVSEKISRVMLITDPELNISGFVQRSRETGIVSGSLLGKCVMRYLAADADIEKGDIILTLGLLDRYPKGIVIGEVVSRDTDYDGVSSSVVVRPKVKLSALEEVFVVK